MNVGDRISGTALSPGRLGDLLFRNRDELLERWERRVLEDPAVPGANDLPRPVLRNHVTSLITKLLSRLVRHPSSDWGERAGREVGSDETGREHARHRFSLHYTQAEAMRELSHFRATILELCEEHDVVMNGEESILVHATVDELMTTTASELESTAIRAREQVLAIVAHDLRTPLGTVLIQAERLATHADEDVRRAGEMLERSCGRMLRLVADLVALSKAEAGQLSVDPHHDDACAVVREVLSELRSLAERKRIAFHVETPSEPVRLACDHDRLVQALGNVVGNAIKFTPDGGIVKVALAVTADECVFAVTDSGPGIDPAHLEDVFRPFWQAPGSPRHGVGLGLAIARGIVEAHGGSIGVERAPDHGAVVVLRMPRDGGRATSVDVAQWPS